MQKNGEPTIAPRKAHAGFSIGVKTGLPLRLILMRVLIVGCGYVGLALARALVGSGHQVYGLRRSSANESTMIEAGIRPLSGDITVPESLPPLDDRFDWVVNTVSSSRGGLPEYESVYLRGTRNLIEWLSPQPPQRFVYTSSTSVYAQQDGAQVKETSDTEPLSETAKCLLKTEQELLTAFRQRQFPAIILRVAGIYGPGRGHRFLQYLRNEARIRGKGDHVLNMIHRDDLVGVIIAALKNARAGDIYNAVDDEPVGEVHFFRWLSETLGKWMPPFETGSTAEPRKRSATSKRVLNRKLKMELGYQFKYPTFRQGYSAEIKRLDDAGELVIAPDPR